MYSPISGVKAICLHYAGVSSCAKTCTARATQTARKVCQHASACTTDAHCFSQNAAIKLISTLQQIKLTCIHCRRAGHVRPASAAPANKDTPHLAPSDLLHEPTALPAAEWAVHHCHHAHKLPRAHLKQDLMTSIHSIRPMSASSDSSAAMHKDSSSGGQPKQRPAQHDSSTAQQRASHIADRKGEVTTETGDLMQDIDQGVAFEQLHAVSLPLAAQHGIQVHDAAMQLSSAAVPASSEALAPIEEISRPECLPGAYQFHTSQEMFRHTQPGCSEQVHGDNNSLDERERSAMSTSSSQQHAAQQEQHLATGLDRHERSHVRASRQHSRRAAGQQQGRPTSRSRWLAAQAHKLQAGLRHMPTAKVTALMLDRCSVLCRFPTKICCTAKAAAAFACV